MVLIAFIMMALALGAGILSLRRVWRGSPNPMQRSWLTRMVLFALGGGVLIVALLLPLPAKHRLLGLVPAFFLGSVFVRVFKAGRARLTGANAEPDLEKMRRLN